MSELRRLGCVLISGLIALACADSTESHLKFMNGSRQLGSDTSVATVLQPLYGYAQLQMSTLSDPEPGVADDETYYELTVAFDTDALFGAAVGDTFEIDGRITIPAEPQGEGLSLDPTELNLVAGEWHDPAIAGVWFTASCFCFGEHPALEQAAHGSVTLTQVAPTEVRGKVDVQIVGPFALFGDGDPGTVTVRGEFIADVLECFGNSDCWEPGTAPGR